MIHLLAHTVSLLDNATTDKGTKATVAPNLGGQTTSEPTENNSLPMYPQLTKLWSATLASIFSVMDDIQ